MSSRRRAAALVLAFALSSGLPLAARASAPAVVPTPPADSPAAGFTDRVAVSYVLVPVVVRTRSGYANRLDRKDFHLSVDGRPVPIESFDKRSEAPTSLVFLQDLSGSMSSKIEDSRAIVRFFLERALEGDEFAVASFAGGRGEVEVPFTADRGAVRDAIARWKGYGTTALHDAVAWIPDISAEGKNSRKFAILVTDGVDNASTLTPAEAREIVRAAQVPVYVLGLGSGSPYELSAKGGKVYRYADVLNLLAAVTGGQYYAIENSTDLSKALAAIGEDLRHQYVLGFSTAGEGATGYRRLDVEVKGAERRAVLFRRGYKGPPPTGTVRRGG